MSSHLVVSGLYLSHAIVYPAAITRELTAHSTFRVADLLGNILLSEARVNA